MVRHRKLGVNKPMLAATTGVLPVNIFNTLLLQPLRHFKVGDNQRPRPLGNIHRVTQMVAVRVRQEYDFGVQIFRFSRR